MTEIQIPEKIYDCNIINKPKTYKNVPKEIIIEMWI